MIRVLIVEDEAILALNLKLGLEANNCNVAGIANSGETAIKKTEETKPDIVLMDIKLRGSMDGIDAALQIMKRYEVPIIYLTGNTDDLTKDRAMQSHPLRYLEKPVESGALCETIQQALQ